MDKIIDWIRRKSKSNSSAANSVESVVAIPERPLSPIENAVKALQFDDYYTLGKQLGSGTFGVVKEATRKLDKTVCAVKILNKVALRGKESMIQSEISVLKQVHHPNIIKLLDLFENQRYVLLVCQLATGGELFEQIVERVPIPYLHG